MLPLEIAGTVLGLLNLWLTIRQNIWCWPVGIACVFCFAVVFLQARLYSDLLLQLVYTAVQIYGWWFWVKHSHQGVHSTYKIVVLNRSQLILCAIAIAGFGLGLGAVMSTFTNADLPYLDALPTAISMAAACMQARKVLQSWLFFIFGNILFIGVYASKGLYVTIALYVVSTILAALGYAKWLQSSQSDPMSKL